MLGGCALGNTAFSLGKMGCPDRLQNEREGGSIYLYPHPLRWESPLYSQISGIILLGLPFEASF